VFYSLVKNGEHKMLAKPTVAEVRRVFRADMEPQLRMYGMRATSERFPRADTAHAIAMIYHVTAPRSAELTFEDLLRTLDDDGNYPVRGDWLLSAKFSPLYDVGQ
jgi:hypothetical protein